MKILVNKCPHTGEIFECDDAYKKHLAFLSRERQRERRQDALNSDFYSWLTEEKSKLLYLADIGPWFIENQKTIINASIAGVWPPIPNFHSFDRLHVSDRFLKLEITGNYHERVSNSHNCPVNGVTNWGGRDKTAPKGYPGFMCEVVGSLRRLPRNDGSYPYDVALAMVGIRQGTGGGGNKSFSFDTELFLEDWPGLKQSVVFEKLKG